MQRVSWFLKISGLMMLALMVAIAGLTTGSVDAQSATKAATTAATAAAQPAKPIALCYSADQVGAVRFVHAAAGGAAVDVYVDNGKTPVAAAVAFGKSVDYWQVAAGTHQFKLTEAGSATKTVATGSVTVAGKNAYTILAAGSPVKLTSLVDDVSDTAGNARLTVINAVTGGPAIDLITTKDNKAAVSKLAEGKQSAALNWAPGTYDLAVIKNGDTTNTALVSLKGTKLDADTITTFVITGTVDKTGKVTAAATTLSSTSMAGFVNPNPPPPPPNTPVPTATKGPSPTATIKPSATPKPPTNTPVPTATKGTPPTAAPKPTATPIPVGKSPASIGAVVNYSKSVHLNGGKCIQVAAVTAGGPADVAGLTKGDIILGVDGVGVDNGGEFLAIIDSHVSGDKVKVAVQRNGKEVDVSVTLGLNPFSS